jgi:hypothetical protein
MNARGRLEMGVQLGYGASHRRPGIPRADNGALGFVYEIVRDQQAGCARRSSQLDGAAIGDERKVLIACILERRNAADFTISLALPGRFQPGGHFLDAQDLELLN